MNKNYTLKELSDIGAKAANSKLPTARYQMTVGLVSTYPDHTEAREAFTKAVLDAIGYEFPKDEEREAFERWLEANPKRSSNDDLLDAWKAGREGLRQALAKNEEEPVCAINPDSKLKESEPHHCSEIWLINKLWQDSMENKSSAATGYSPEGYCMSEAEADLLVSEGGTVKANGWPLMWDTPLRRKVRVKQLFPNANEAWSKTDPPWIPWNGGECPLPDTVKKWELRYRGGAKEVMMLRPSAYCWIHCGSGADIFAYRVWE